jgi:hypothetical protein
MWQHQADATFPKATFPKNRVPGTNDEGKDCQRVAGAERHGLSMDILASIFAYMVCMAGLLTGLIMSFVVFFSTPSQQVEAPTRAIAMIATPSSSTAVKQSADKEFQVKTVAKQTDARGGVAAADAAAVQVALAADAQQKPLLSPNRMRRLERARHLAYRERSSFETRFLHYDD